MDIEDFIDLKKNSGEERRRAHDLFPALWINDLFMKRILNDEHWTLFDPYEVRELSALSGDEFEAKYVELENDPNITKEQMSAKGLWKKILTSYFESGSPFLCWKDNANRANPNPHTGFIRSSNLCTEIFQNTNPNHYRIKIELEDGEILTFEEDEKVTVNGDMIKKANKVTALDSYEGKKIFIVEKEKIDGDTAVCNLASVNLSKINTKEDIERVVPTAIRMLDNVIDLNFYPLRKVKATNLKTRAIGLGVMGESQMLAEQQLAWGTQDHLKKIDSIMEAISYNAIKASSALAVEKGIYPTFEGSNWSKGMMPMDYAPQAVNALVQKDLFDAGYDWDALREEVKTNGMRNGYLMAIAPTSSISILVGTTQAIEPVYKRKWFEENLSGQIPVVVPNLAPENWNYYTPAYEVEQTDIIKAAAIRQKWIDQGQSTNIFMSLDKASGRYLHEIYTLAWQLGLKSTYYLRSQSPEAVADVADRSMECIGCQ
jgi:ribonucleoside-diphosphate reductase alpha chain